MEAGSTLSIYSELYGWYYYAIVWEVLASTGIAIIPIATMIIDHLIKARERASLWGHSSDSLLAGLETKLIVTLGVLALAALPNPMTTVSPESYTHLEPASVYNDAPNQQTAGNTGTTFDQAYTDPRLGGYGTDVPVPPFWLLVTAISHGVTHAVQSQVDERGRALEGIKRALEIASVRNPDVQVRLQQFYNECYAPARARYARSLETRDEFALNTLGTGGDGVPAELEDFEGVDIARLNSLYFIENDEYYPSIRTRHPVPGFDYDPDVDVQYSSPPAHGNGHPTCLEFLDQLLNSMRADNNHGRVLGTMLRGAQYVPGLDAVAEDWIIDKYFAEATRSYQSQADVAVARRNEGKNAWAKGIGDAWAAYELGKLAVAASIFVDAMIYALHQLRAIVMIIVLMALPIGLVLSGYSIGFLIQASFVVFTVIFISAIWSIASWAETALVESFFPNLYELKEWLMADAADGLAAVKKRLALSSAVGMFYIVMPAAFIWIMAAAGSRATSSISLGSGTRDGNATGISGRGIARGVGKAVGRIRRG